MLTTTELRHWVGEFGVAASQVRRDHLVSHVLQALAGLGEPVVFIGGTALCRTHLPDWRLSEDIDLLAPDPSHLAVRLHDELPHLLRREFPGAATALDSDPVGMAGAIVHGDLRVRVHIVALDSSHRRYPVALQEVALRFEDLPAHAMLYIPTATSAAAMKLNAWTERAAPRDLCDLFGLATHGLLDDRALELASDAGRRPAPWMFADDRVPTDRAWQAALGHQMAELPDAQVAMTTVRTCLFGA